MIRNRFIIALFYFILISGGIAQEAIDIPRADSTMNYVIKPGDIAPSWVMMCGPAKFEWLRNWSVQKGQRLRLSSTQPDHHVVVMSFFATWCIPCMKELPHLETLYQKYKDQKIKFFLIDITEATRNTPGYENAAESGPFLSNKGITIQVLNDHRGVAKEKYGVTTLPRLFVIDKYQTVRLSKQGYYDDQDFEGELATLFDTLLAQE